MSSSFIRAGLAAALLWVAPFAAASANTAEKPFQNSDLADAAITLEAQIKSDAGAAAKPLPQIRKDADAAFAKNDFRAGMALLGQIVAAAPNDSTTWLRLARSIMQIRPADDKEKALLLERASTAAYIAYQRTASRGEEANSLAFLGHALALREQWRPALDALRLSLELHEVADVRGQYELLREAHGFRVLDYSVDADTASPRACFQFSEDLPARTDFSPFVVLAGTDKPALSAAEKQICVEGLQHGETYNITLRAGLPSTVHETLSKSGDYAIYVRDRKPSLRFTTTSYVLPRTGQRGIPIISTNTKAAAIEIFRLADRNLVDTVTGENRGRADFQRSLNRYDVDQLRESRGVSVWKGELTLESAALNADVTTAFPLDQAVGELKPGVYVMVAQPQETNNLDNNVEALATQWFIVSDLGLTAFSGNDGIHVFVNSLASALAKKDIELKLVSRSNEVLATRRTDAAGHAQFEAGLTSGEGGVAPAMLTASDGQGDYAFLNLRGPAFDLTDRGVGGRPAPAGLDAFVYSERGVYRSGETAYLTALLRDTYGAAALGVPLTLVVERPDGVEFRRVSVADQGLGGHPLALALPASAPSGTWHVRAFTDPKRPAVGEASFLVEDYVPDRIAFDLSSPSGHISQKVPAKIDIAGRFLYGAPAAGLDLEGEVTIAAAKERTGFAGYQFGLDDEEVEPVEQSLEDLPDTDAAGKASFTVNLNKLPAGTHPLEARITVRMAEPGGRAVEHNVVLPVTANGPMIGVKPQFSGRSLADGANAVFDVVALAPDGAAMALRGLHYELLRIETHYQFYKQNGRWNYEPVKTTKRVADGTIDTTLDKPSQISLPVNFGRYRLEVSAPAPNGPVTSIAFDAGFYVETNADTPDMLDVAVDKGEYAPGDTMTAAVTARTAGRLTLNVIGDRLLATQTTDVPPGVAKVKVPVGRDWSTGAYLVATLQRPLDAPAQRMPGRAIGLQWFSIDRAAKTLGVELKAPALIRPNSALHVPVKISGLAAGEDARVVVAAVDVGILNLTNYKAPSPDDYYLGQQALSVDIRDLYGQLIDGMQGMRGQIRSGGDQGAELQASPPSGPPVALYSGLVTVGADGNADVDFDMPDFSGTVRVMAVAWSKGKVGHVGADVVVRDPVVLTATLPRFLLPGDRSSLHLDLDNVEGAAGDYTIAVTGDGVVAATATQKLSLSARQRGAANVPVVANAAGNGTIKVSVNGPGGYALSRNLTLAVRMPAQILARRTVISLAKGESLALSSDMFADLVPGTGAVSVSVGASAALDAAALLAALDRYPYRCSEQITSRALPLLYVSELTKGKPAAADPAADQHIRDAIEALLTRQDGNGSFGLWGVGGGDTWLDAYVTDFLTRAREHNIAVTDGAFKLALNRLRNVVANTADPDKDGAAGLAYALYVLARNRMAPVGDLRYLADAKLDALATPIAKAQIAAALGMVGDRVRADRVYAAALAAMPASASGDLVEREDFGSTLRDAAALVALASESGAPRATVRMAVQRVEAARADLRPTSTQEDAWLLLAANDMAKDAGKISLDVGGVPLTAPLNRTIRAGDLKESLRITNTGEDNLSAVMTVTGAPVTPEPAAEKGFKIERSTTDMDGTPVDVKTVKQNTRLVVVLKVTEAQPQFGRVIVADYLPAGFEIDNPHLVSSGETGTLSWITDAVQPVNAEFRDDRFTAAFDRSKDDGPVFTVAYVVRAVAPGKYVRPQAKVEDMYRPDRFGRTATETVEVTAR
ncbi:MAG: alpha-2-macroglobulin family protein [Hyphomicrobiales bacterium]|nr:alpha-2-macroglobulin family protein [Hyphomicrobiales bacterium]